MTSNELEKPCPACGYMRDVAKMEQPCPMCRQIERKLDPLATDVARGSARKALPDLRELAAKHKTHLEVQRQLATAYVATKRVDDAIKAWAHVTSLAPEDADAFFELAQAYSQRGKMAEARAALERVLELAPDHPQAKIELSGIEDRIKQQEAGTAGRSATGGGRVPGQKSPVGAAILSFLWHGAGQMYLGQTTKGLLFLILYLVWNGVATLAALTAIGLVVAIPMWVVSFAFSIAHAIDAHMIGNQLAPNEIPQPWSFFKP